MESLTSLLKTIGENLDSTDRGRPMMDAYFKRIGAMIETPDLPSRLKFMLMVGIYRPQVCSLLTLIRILSIYERSVGTPKAEPLKGLPRLMKFEHR